MPGLANEPFSTAVKSPATTPVTASEKVTEKESSLALLGEAPMASIEVTLGGVASIV